MLHRAVLGAMALSIGLSRLLFVYQIIRAERLGRKDAAVRGGKNDLAIAGRYLGTNPTK